MDNKIIQAINTLIKEFLVRFENQKALIKAKKALIITRTGALNITKTPTHKYFY